MKKIKKTTDVHNKKNKHIIPVEVSGLDKGVKMDNVFYQRLVESLEGHGIFTTDKVGIINSWNSGAQKLFGYTEEEVVGKNVSLIFSVEDTHKNLLQKEFSKVLVGGKLIVERYHIHKNGSRFWASSLIFLLGDKNDATYGFTFIVRDLTEKLEFEKRKDAFISTATHELKTPITSMKLYVDIVEREIKKSGNTKNIESVAKLDKQLNKLVALMDYLLDVSKIQKGTLHLEKEMFDIDLLIDETIGTVQAISKTHKIIREGGVGESVYGDKDRLAQVLMNLITNAIKYSPQQKKIIIKSVKKTDQVIISIQDFGMGISQSEQGSLFGRFYRASGALNNHIEGIGLGLYVGRQIVQAHKGRMWLESEEGQGSTFYFSIPRKNK